MKDSDVFPLESSAPDGSRTLSESLLVRLRGDDPDAWRRLTALFGPIVYAWCRRAGLQTEDAADVGQEVFRSVARNLPVFRRDRPGDSFQGWLWTLTRNKIRDHWRRLRDRPVAAGGSTALQFWQELPADSDGSIDKPPGGGDEVFRRALELVRSGFEDRTWRAFWLVVVEDRPPTDVATELGLTPGAVYVAKSRVLRRLREEFGDLLDQG